MARIEQVLEGAADALAEARFFQVHEPLFVGLEFDSSFFFHPFSSSQHRVVIVRCCAHRAQQHNLSRTEPNT